MSSTKKKIYLSLTILVVLALAGYFTLQLSKSRTFQFFGGLTDRVYTNDKIVALTFDDAPTDKTGEVLNVLAEKNVKATFYVIGQNAESYPEQLKEIISSGNEVGNHSYSHQRFLFKSPSFIASEVEKTDQLIRNAGYSGKITFRPPNGKKLFGLPWYLSRHNIETIIWDVEPDTYYQGNADALINYTLDHTKPGSIILLHPFCNNECSADREALPKIIDKLSAEGYRFLTVSQLLEYKEGATK